MTAIAVTTMLAGQPVNALADDPEIRIRRLDTGALVITDDPMTDQGGDGLYTFAFAPVAGLEYSFLIDADPSATGQVDLRYFDGAFDDRIEDLWDFRGLDPANAKVTEEVTVGEDYDEDVAGKHVDQVKAGTTTTTTRTT